MPDREKVIKGLEICTSKPCYCTDCPYKKECCLDSQNVMEEALALLKEQEPRELTIAEWRKWKADSKRNPICKLWEHDTSPIWILNPNDVHEPALLMGKLKLFTGKPNFEQCKAVKWSIPSKEEAEEFTQSYLAAQEAYYKKQDCFRRSKMNREKVKEALETINDAIFEINNGKTNAEDYWYWRSVLDIFGYDVKDGVIIKERKDNDV